MRLAHTELSTPLGRYALVAGPRGLVWAGPAEARPGAGGASGARAGSTLAAARDAFARYFDGACDALDPLALDPGGTPFQRRVWDALRRIPIGETAGYGEVARRIGCPGGARAVGAASGANPVAIAIPCHRAVGRDGRLVGYAGGLARKRWLLALEASWLHAASSTSPSGASSAWARSRDSADASI